MPCRYFVARLFPLAASPASMVFRCLCDAGISPCAPCAPCPLLSYDSTFNRMAADTARRIVLTFYCRGQHRADRELSLVFGSFFFFSWHFVLSLSTPCRSCVVNSMSIWALDSQALLGTITTTWDPILEACCKGGRAYSNQYCIAAGIGP